MAALVVLGLEQSTGAQGSSPELALGIIRIGAKLAPFAVRVGGTWKQAWPEPDGDFNGSHFTNVADVPNAWRELGIPIPDTWHVLVSQALDAHVTGFDSAHVACGSQAAFTTDLLPTSDLVGRFAIVGADYKWRQIQALTTDDNRWSVVEHTMQPAFEPLERAEYQQPQTALRTLPDPASGQTPQLKQLFGEATLGPLYAVMEKRYRDPLPCPDCAGGKEIQPPSTVLTGWLVPSAKGFVLVGTRVFLTNPDWKGVVRWVPQAHLITPGADVWLAQGELYEGSSEAVLAVDATGAHTLLEVGGGGC